ncbi:hypothetical protein V3481_002021 [Fusarium oxysporum f. sp. vasinfectum]|nr:hypothetical protein HZ326_6975 [Fusarium oxysporum f. sp. albedinis]
MFNYVHVSLRHLLLLRSNTTPSLNQSMTHSTCPYHNNHLTTSSSIRYTTCQVYLSTHDISKPNILSPLSLPILASAFSTALFFRGKTSPILAIPNSISSFPRIPVFS